MNPLVAPRQSPGTGPERPYYREYPVNVHLCEKSHDWKNPRIGGSTASLDPSSCPDEPEQHRPRPGHDFGPGVRLATSMRSPQAGRSARDQAPPEEVREQSESVRNKAHQAARNNNDETGATGSSSPRYAPAPR
jgi:hypothetical protein